MKKNVIALVVLLAAAGGSVGAYLAVKDKKDDETKQYQEQIADLSLFNFDAESINKIEFISSEGKYTAELADSTWQLTNGDDFPLDQDYINLLRTYVSQLNAETSYSGNKADYGLDDENASTIILSSSDQSYTIHIGNVSPTKDYYYVSVGEKDQIYAVSSLYGSEFSTDRLMLKAKELVPYDDFGISEIIIKKNDEITCELKYDPESYSWSLPEEYSGLTFDNTAVTSMVNSMTRLQAEQMLDENLEDLSKYGFDDPYAEVTIKGLDGTERVITIGNSYNGGTYSNVLIGDDNQVEAYYTADLNFVDKTPFDFLADTIYNPSMYEVTGLDLTFGGKEYNITIDTNESKGTFNGTEFNMNIMNVSTAFQNFYSSFTTVILSGIDMKAEPTLDEPLLTAVYHCSDGTDFTYQLVAGENENCYIFNDGKYTGMLLSSSRLTGKNSVQSFLEKFISTANLE